jgi:predicted alpha/beta-hydrolase family hydrolase
MSDNPEDELELLTDGPPDADWTLILAHGAGQGMDSSFMAHIAGALAPSIHLAWIDDGDHSFKPRGQSGRTWEQNLDQAAQAVVDFVASL